MPVRLWRASSTATAVGLPGGGEFVAAVLGRRIEDPRSNCRGVVTTRRDTSRVTTGHRETVPRVRLSCLNMANTAKQPVSDYGSAG